MIAKPQPRPRWLTILLLVAAAGLWIYNQKHPETTTRKPSAHSSPAPSSQQEKPPAPSTPTRQGGIEKIGGYEVYRGCTLVDARNNDGDSFMLRLANGKQAEFRLYFVDTPESAFKSYRGGDTNRQRIEEQAAELGGITAEQAVEIGQKGKHFTLDLLASKPFDIYTRWDSPFNDNRFHAFVEVKPNGTPRWLDELLVEKGLVRIHTKGADLPDGTPYAQQKAHLKSLESAAKKAGIGVWGK